MITYDNITLVPRHVSQIAHRSKCDTSIECFGTKLNVPIIAAPMPDVCNGEMAYALSGLGAMGIIHRFQDMSLQTTNYGIYSWTDKESPIEMAREHDELSKNVACAIGVTGDYQERFEMLYEAGCRIFCLDTANGANIQVEEAVKWIRERDEQRFTVSTENIYAVCPPKFREKTYLIAGNVATKEGFEYLQDLGVDAVRVGIAGGCFTKNMNVITSKGSKEIGEIQVGDMVLSHNGSFNTVENKFEFDRDEEIMVINGIECTKNHEFCVLNKKYEKIVNEDNIENYIEWVAADKLTEEYFLIKLD